MRTILPYWLNQNGHLATGARFFREVICILSKDTISQAKSIDLLNYLQRYEPDELVHIAGNEYSTKSHDSLKISNGKWFWFSRGVGGTSALDYLIYVRGLRFSEAVMKITGNRYQEQVRKPSSPSKPETKQTFKPAKKFVLPPAYDNSNRVINYLQSRGISLKVIHYCMDQGLLYEDSRYHNAVFVGFDPAGMPRHAMLRGISPGNSFRQDAAGSDKRYTFSLPAPAGSEQLYVYESAIDLLSHATIDCSSGIEWLKDHRLSLAGLAPLALDQFIKDHPEIQTVILCLDQDEPGRAGTKCLSDHLLAAGKAVHDEPPPTGKDYNEHLCSRSPKTSQFIRGQNSNHFPFSSR